jgi:predicted ATP-grasp superfamily ATP-dependent carboligase
MSNSAIKMNNVLILDSDTLPALAITRSLGRQGITVTTASHQDKPISSFSKFSSNTCQYPHPLNQTKDFLRWVEEQLLLEKYQLIIPATERTLVSISRHFSGSRYEHLIAIPPLEALEQVLDKAKTTELANECDVPLPDCWDIESTSDIERHKHEFTYPMVIKPGRSISDTRQRVSLTVSYAHSIEELLKICSEQLQHTHLVLQRYFSGIGVGIELIASKGEILYAFQHQRLHEMPLSGGGSSYRKSVEIDPELLEASRHLIRALNWHGIAMVELKKDPASGKFILIEINGRFWGSLPLAVAAGANFPFMLFQLYTTGNITTNEPYRREVSCRKLSSDLRWLEAVIRKDADQRLVSIPTVGSALKDLLPIFSSKHYFDAQSLTDLKPGLIDLKLTICSYLERFFGQRQEKKYRNTIITNSHYTQIKAQTIHSKKILFLCYGNINRSAVAHALADAAMKESGQYEFKSAGFHLHGNRPADPQMKKIAQANHVDMNSFLSSVITTELTDWADLIFVMESSHITKLKEFSSASAEKAFLLGGLYQKGKAIEIDDPYNKPFPVYQGIYEKVRRCISNLATLDSPTNV